MSDEEAVAISVDESLLGAAPDAGEIARLLRTIEEEARTISTEKEPDKDVPELQELVKD